MDRFLFSVDWMDKAHMIVREALHKWGSNHIPIMLQIEQIPSGPRPFQFELMWLEISGFKEKLKSWWVEISVSGTTRFVFGQKLKNLKSKFLQWKKTEFGGIEAKKVDCLQKLGMLEMKEMVGQLSEVEGEVKKDTIDEYHRLLRMEEISETEI